MNSTKSQVSNPIPAVLDLFSEDEYVYLEPVLLDEIRKVIFNNTNSRSFVNDKYIFLLLKFLHDHNLVELNAINTKAVNGWIFYIKKVVHG